VGVEVGWAYTSTLEKSGMRVRALAMSLAEAVKGMGSVAAPP
jgi:hypothetical protein